MDKNPGRHEQVFTHQKQPNTKLQKWDEKLIRNIKETI
jgi:hypothetical protein